MPYLRSYHINENDSNVKKTKQIPKNKLLDKFKPENDAIDRRIYYGVTNKKIDPNEKFLDESDEEESTNPIMMALQNSRKDSLQRRNTFDPGVTLRQSKYRKVKK